MTQPDTPAPSKADPKNYQPDPALKDLFPDISANTINGLGETERRRPTLVFWSDEPPTIPHGQLQLYFYGRNASLPLVMAEREIRQSYIDIELPPVAPVKAEHSPAEWSRLIKEKAAEFDADAVGITQFDRSWVFEGNEFDAKWVIVLGVAHDYDRISQAPEEPAAAEVIKQYGRATKVTKALAGWLHEQGFETVTHSGPNAGHFTMIPAAIAAGLGELGKHGSMINRKFGSSFRLASITIDMPLVADEPDDFGVDDFCARCQVCQKACPPDALASEKQLVRGQSKWYVNFDKCIQFFNETAGCSICISRCPWSRPGIADNLLAKLARRRAKTD